MQKRRIVWFVLMIAFGLAVGLLYGWIINPIRYTSTDAGSLRWDYKADYVLMTSEIYKMDSDPQAAAQRLSLIDNRPPVQVIAESLKNARSLGYPPADLHLMESLSQALQTPTPSAKRNP